MERRWIINHEATDDQIELLSDSLEYSKVLCNLLIQRGITTKEDAISFFNPNLSDLHDPFLMKDMDKAIARLDVALERKEKILVYGDYDVDGTTSVALVYSFLKTYCKDIFYYIPDRYQEGYGVSLKGIEYAAENGYSLMIVLDCGIKAVEKIAVANEKNVDIIICDHHTPGDSLPNAVAVLDPKRKDCSYPCEFLSGCGVGFKLVHGYCQKNNIPLENIYKLLDLLCVSIASDIVPIIGENRILASEGLKRLNKTPCVGLQTIKNLANIEKDLTINDIVFKMGPRINAAGRVESGNQSVELLVVEDPKESKDIGDRINHINNERKKIDHTITDEALEEIKNSEALKDKKSTVLFNTKWHKGVIGIVASRLIETYYRPTVILTESNGLEGLATGSARSVEGYDLYSAISECSEYLENYGGHKYAAGLTLKTENIEAFTNKFEKYVASTIKDDMLTPQIHVDAEISFDEINEDFFEKLLLFAPFGPQNLSPVFVTRGVVDYGSSKTVGKNREHLKLVITDTPTSSYPRSTNAIAFNMGHLHSRIHSGEKFDICYALQENVYMGVREIQLLVRDIKFSE
ncbi:MAG: single-stranded-DNA-specific exonuclease RecJ [Marinifilaceae bacterium]